MRAHEIRDGPAQAADGAGFGQWTSEEQGREYGLIRAEYAQQWAQCREANGCNYLDGC